MGKVSNAEARENVQVAVRVRPMLEREVVEGVCTSSVAVGKKGKEGQAIYISKRSEAVVLDTTGGEPASSDIMQFTFDHVFDHSASQTLVYNTAVAGLVKHVLDGHNCTIFAYGQTGTGKTYTMTGGVGAKRGITLRALADIFSLLPDSDRPCDDDLLADNQPSPKASSAVYVSFLQIYNEQVMDLLDPSKSNLKLKEDGDGGTFAEGLTHVSVSCVDDVVGLMNKAMAARATASTKLNDFSSRSHSIVQVAVNQYTGSEVQQSLLNLVDLAGSERVKNSGVAGDQLKEAQNINKSLFALAGVVQSLVDGTRKHVPYRDSKLTHLLRGSLGGKSRTLLVATVSPSKDAGAESCGTLRFAHACKAIKNETGKPSKKAVRDVPKPSRKVVVPWDGEYDEGQYTMLETSVGPIAVRSATGSAAGQPAVILLHGCPSSAEEWSYWLPALRWGGYRVLAIDMPGRGRSPGTPFKSRSEFNLDPGGPVDVVLAVMRCLDIKQAHFVGYDWGAGILLSLAMAHPGKVKSSVIILPSFGEKVKDELKSVRAKVLVVWVKEDRMHSWQRWKPLAAKLPNGAVEMISLGSRFNETTGRAVYASDPVVRSRITAPVLRFLTGIDPLQRVATVYTPPCTETHTTKGTAVRQVQTIVLNDGDLDDSEIHRLCQRPESPSQQAVDEFVEVYARGDLPQMFTNASLGKHVPLFAALPSIDPELIGDGGYLAELGVWETTSLAGHHTMATSPRYFVGRRVLAKAAGLDPDYTSDTYMHLKAGASGTFVTHHAVVAGHDRDKGTFTITIPTEYGTLDDLVVPQDQIFALNQPQVFRKDDAGRLVFEDGVKCSYESPLVRAKILEIALALRPVVRVMDFTTDVSELQRKALQIIAKCLNITSFKGGMDRTRVGRTDDVGKLAANGQGHCHGMSTTFAAFLLPFAEAIGVDIHYRGGFFFDRSRLHDMAANKGGTTVSNDVELHQWIDVTLRPSCTTVVCDLHQNIIAEEAQCVYSTTMYPNGKLLIATSTRLPSPTDLQF